MLPLQRAGARVRIFANDDRERHDGKPRAASRLAAVAARVLRPTWRQLACGAVALLVAAWLAVRAHLLAFAAEREGLCTAWAAAHYPPLAPKAQAAAVQQLLALAAGGSASTAQGTPRPFVHLVLFVPSSAGQAARRAPLRRQYARSRALLPAGIRTELVFVVGRDALGSAPGLQQEADSERDILLADCPDADGAATPAERSSTTCKVVAALQHAVSSWDFAFIARVGDDAYFRFDQFLLRVAPRHLPAPGQPAPPLVVSRFLGGGRTGLLADAYHTPVYPPYPGGAGYVFSAPVVRALLAAHAHAPLLDGYPEDAVVGLWLMPFKREVLDSPCFHDSAEIPGVEQGAGWGARGDKVLERAALRLLGLPQTRHYNAGPCSSDSLLIHYMTPQLWAQVGEDGVVAECGHMA